MRCKKLVLDVAVRAVRSRLECFLCWHLRFTADKAFLQKLERLAEVLGIDNSTGNMREVLEKALDSALDRKDPRRKLDRRLKRELYCAREELGDAFVQAMIQSKRGLAIPPPTGKSVSHAPGTTPERMTSPDVVRISIS